MFSVADRWTKLDSAREDLCSREWFTILPLIYEGIVCLFMVLIPDVFWIMGDDGVWMMQVLLLDLNTTQSSAHATRKQAVVHTTILKLKVVCDTCIGMQITAHKCTYTRICVYWMYCMYRMYRVIACINACMKHGCMYLCTYVGRYVCTSVCRCMYLYVRFCMSVCMYLSIYLYVCVSVCMCICLYEMYVYLFVQYVCMYVCMHACMHACMYVCMYVCNAMQCNAMQCRAMQCDAR